MRHIVWTRIDNRLIRGRVITQWIQCTEASEVLIIGDGVAEDSFLQMVMKSNVSGKINLKVLNVKDTIGYLNEDGEHEKITILVKTLMALDELGDAGVRPRSVDAGGIGTRTGRKPIFKNVSASEEEKEAFRNLLNKGINVLLRIIVTEPEEDITKYLQKGSGIPMRIRSSQIAYRRQQDK